jgi:hypothetical protein
MKALAILGFFALQLPLVAHASLLDGVWKGPGQYESTSSYTGSFNAKPAEVEIRESGSKLFIRDCWTDPGRIQVCSSRELAVGHNGDLYYQGFRVGRLTPRQITIYFTVNAVEVDSRIWLDANDRFNFVFTSQKSSLLDWTRTTAFDMARE